MFFSSVNGYIHLILINSNSRDGERERDISGTVRQCEKYYIDLLNIDQNSSKSGKGKSLQKGKTSPNGEALHVVSDLEFWKTSEEDVSILLYGVVYRENRKNFRYRDS